MNAEPSESRDTQTDDRIVKAGDVARRYKVTPRAVFKWKDENRIPFIKIGKTIRFDLRKVIAAIEGEGGSL